MGGHGVQTASRTRFESHRSLVRSVVLSGQRLNPDLWTRIERLYASVSERKRSDGG